MTSKKAIEILYKYTLHDLDYPKEDIEAFEFAIKALEKEPCEDCISRQAMLAIVGDSCLDLDSYEDTREFCDEIKELPSVIPKGVTVTDFADKCRECGKQKTNR